jgi:hypothetical protein
LGGRTAARLTLFGDRLAVYFNRIGGHHGVGSIVIRLKRISIPAWRTRAASAGCFCPCFAISG